MCLVDNTPPPALPMGAGLWLTSFREMRGRLVWEAFSLGLSSRAPLLLAAAASQPGKHQAIDSLPRWQVMPQREEASA